ICTDLRYPDEYEKIRELGGKIVYVYRSKTEEARKLGIQEGHPTWSHESEALAEFLYDNADARIFNEGTVDDLWDQTTQTIINLFGEGK
ncbi:MAG: hypothetical protein ACRDBG_28270, partial [Waterburya sp.]